MRRAELHTAGENRGRLRVHDLRGTFVTLNLAAGKSETWVADRTGHTSSVMINRYRRTARTAKELALGELKPLDAAIPELARIAHGLPTKPPPVALKSFRRGWRSSRIRLGGPSRTRTGIPLLERDFKSAFVMPERARYRRNAADFERERARGVREEAPTGPFWPGVWPGSGGSFGFGLNSGIASSRRASSPSLSSVARRACRLYR